MKTYKEFMQEAATDYEEMTISPVNVKVNGDKVKYKLKATVDGKEVKDPKLINSVINALGDKEIQKDLKATPKADILSTEVESDKKGKYITVNKKKLYFK